MATVVTPNLPEAELLLDGADPQAWAEQIGVAVLIPSNAMAK